MQEWGSRLLLVSQAGASAESSGAVVVVVRKAVTNNLPALTAAACPSIGSSKDAVGVHITEFVVCVCEA
jgi:hypothetical protein